MTMLPPELIRGNRLKVSAWAGPHPALVELPRCRAATPLQGRDQATGAVYVSDGSALPSLGALGPRQSWACVAALLLAKTQEMTGFDPVGAAYDVTAWSSYLRKLATMPFLRAVERDHRDWRIPPHASMAVVREAFGEMCARFSEPVRGAFAEALVATTALAERRPAGRQKTSHQMVAGIVEASGRVQLVQLWTSVSLVRGEGEVYRPPPQIISLRCSVRSLDYLKCVRHASTLLRWKALPVADWVQAVNSSPGRFQA